MSQAEMLVELEPPRGPAPGGGVVSVAVASLSVDSSFRAGGLVAEQVDQLVAWFERTAVGEADVALAKTVPLSRVYMVAEEARRRSETWLQFARALEARPPNPVATRWDLAKLPTAPQPTARRCSKV